MCIPQKYVPNHSDCGTVTILFKDAPHSISLIDLKLQLNA